MRNIRMLGLALLGALTLAGCGDDDDRTTGTLGSFEGNITGAITATLGGNAVYGLDQNDDLFELALVDAPVAAPPFTLALGIIGRTTLPPNGTYTVGLSANNINGSLYVLAPDDFYYLNPGGTLTITTSSENNVRGTFNFTAHHETAAPGTASITITGSFIAECVPDAELNITCG